MSSTWQDKRNKPWNPIKVTEKFSATWGGGQFTCFHSMNDAAGPWWRA